jgi:hypothetical protein
MQPEIRERMGFKPASWDVASDPSILFLRIGIIELETKHLDMKILLSNRASGLLRAEAGTRAAALEGVNKTV